MQTGESFTHTLEAGSLNRNSLTMISTHAIGRLIHSHTLIKRIAKKRCLSVLNIKPQLKFLVISSKSMIESYKHIWISDFSDSILESICSQYFLLKDSKPWDWEENVLQQYIWKETNNFSYWSYSCKHKEISNFLWQTQ